MICSQGVLRVVLNLVSLMPVWYILGILVTPWNSWHGLTSQKAQGVVTFYFILFISALCFLSDHSCFHSVPITLFAPSIFSSNSVLSWRPLAWNLPSVTILLSIMFICLTAPESLPHSIILKHLLHHKQNIESPSSISWTFNVRRCHTCLLKALIHGNWKGLWQYN